MKKGRWFWGSFALIGAAILLGSQLGWFTYSYSPWTLIFTLFLAATFITSLVSLWISGVVFSLAALSIVYASALGIAHISVWMIILIAILVNIGLSLIFHPWIAKHHRKQMMSYHHGSHYFEENIHSRHFNAHTNEDTDTALYFVDKVTSSTRYLHNKQLEQVTFEVSLGDLKAYFDDVVPAQSDLVVNLNVSMGQAELFIPKDWQVSNELEYTMGTVDVPDSIISDVEGITVHLRGQVSFGQVNVHYI